MGTTSGKQLAVGLRLATVFILDSNGYPAAPDENVYEGLEFEGGKAWALSAPGVRNVVHMGNDRVLATDTLPASEGLTAELRVATQNQPVNALLTGVKEFTVGEKKLIPWLTDIQGSEPDVGLLLYQISLDRDTKSRRYRFHISPKSRCIPDPASMDENATEILYKVSLPPSTNHIWGTAMSVSVEGCTEAALIEGMAVSRPKLVAWQADGIAVEFLFNTLYPAVSVSKMTVWTDGVLTTETDAVTGVTFAVAPAAGAMIVCMYEY